MKKIFIILFLILSIFSIVNAHPFKSEKELYDYYTKIDKKINEELKNSPEKILKDRKDSLKTLSMDVFGADKVLGDDNYLFGFDKNGKIMSVMKRAVLDGPSMIARIYYPNGNLKEVYLDDDDFVTGIVRTYYENGKKYEEIPYYKGKKEGLRKIYFENGNLSNEVHYVDDLREGKTTDYYNNGNIFRLKHYKDNIGNGEFTEYYRNGQIKVKGNYKGGLREGEFKFYSESNKYLGSVFYKNKEIIKNTLNEEDMKDLSASFEFADMALFLRSTTHDTVGIAADVYLNGKPKLCMPYNVNGELHGDYIEFYENGQISYEITYENGLRQGKSITYLENGKIIGETNYIDGKKEGKSLETFIDMIQKKANYKNNKIDGDMFLYYPSGKLLQKRSFVNGKAEGELIEYYENGVIKEKAYFINDKQEKEHLFYDEKGNLIKTDIYKNGIKQ
ncbi:toxin-antitoxin system YwqK family antitoxin [Fusobacterium simiae]|uniref:Toxin-antitoxin system YwqK family antitoxin n=1 Tax=Fusobacterium simiae TaxID=855 RepID=A0ABT4DHP0_FUSSI|nr:toxin-antitoxin system YwqK family antitoxin [Fusobacterium simiae]MCY7008125.1 toxin-antitoxin system YwqK family antitoxin [Fusobacterium simiae]